MTPDEALVFTCFDSADDGRARFTAHAAVRDLPGAPPDARPRESVEIRSFAFY
jgi:hypothetical protein